MEEEEDKKQKQIITEDPPPPPPPPPRIQSPPWLSPTFTYDVDGFLYHPGLSAAGIFSSGGTFRFLRPYPKLNLPAPSFFNVPTPFTVLSSSSGLLLVRSSSTYHVLNPFVHSPVSHRRIPPPLRPHPPTTPAVLAVRDSVFHVICAVEVQEPYRRGSARYTFNIFSSDIDMWSITHEDHAMLLDRRRILSNTGVSNDRGMAFWLTNVPPIIVKVMLKDGVIYPEQIIIPQDRIDPWASLQLGRLSKSDIGLIAASRVNVVLLRLRLDGSWWSHGFLNVTRNENEAGDEATVLPVVCGGWQKQPEVMRFEKDAVMRISGRMVVWEIDWEHQSTRIERLHTMPAWTRRLESVEDAVPYVYTDLTAQTENMSTNDVDSFKYHPGLSTAGFFSSAASSAPAFHLLRPYPPLDIPTPSFFDIPAPFIILSSSGGLLLIRSLPNSTYHVLNPFLHSPTSHRQIPALDSPHTPTTPAVLAVDTRDGDSAYHIICAVEEETTDENDRCYTFDIYSSNTGEWTSTDFDDAVYVGTSRIIPSTGVTNGRAMAFWLTDGPQVIVKVTVGEDYDYSELIDIPSGMLKRWARLQLGRLSESLIGIVATTRTDVVLLRLELDHSLEKHGFLNVKSRENEAVNDPSSLSVVSEEWPEVMRFERDAMIWINGRMVVWEIDCEQRITRVERVQTRVERLHTMPAWPRRPPSVRDWVPYVYTERAAGDFTVAVFEEEGA